MNAKSVFVLWLVLSSTNLSAAVGAGSAKVLSGFSFLQSVAPGAEQQTTAPVKNQKQGSAQEKPADQKPLDQKPGGGNAPQPVSASPAQPDQKTSTVKVQGEGGAELTLKAPSITVTATAGPVQSESSSQLKGNDSSNTKNNPAPSDPGCDNCFLSIGIGTNLNPRSYSDYTNANNLLQTTHLGNETPQLLLGVSYGLPFRSLVWKPLNCSVAYPSGKEDPKVINNAQEINCYPWRAFLNVKFSTGGSQSFNGFTLGLSRRFAKSLDLMLGASFSPFNQVTPGFQKAAVATVIAQQAAGNSHYADFSAFAMQKNYINAFDGFPTFLVTPTGMQGPPIYNGSPLSVRYLDGGFFGVAVPLSFKKLAGIP